MFSNFVTFNEVTKLSRYTHLELKHINYDDSILDFIFDKHDVDSFTQVAGLIRDGSLATRFISMMNFYNYENDRKWLLSIFEVIIKKGNVNINYYDNRLLVCSSAFGYMEIVKYLLERPDCKVCKERCCHRANVHAQSNCSLRLASSNGHLEVVKLLIRNGADVHTEYECSLMAAANNCHLEVVEYLIENGANIHILEEYTFRQAVKNNNLAIVKCLVERPNNTGADIHALNDFALICACENGYYNIVRYLVSKGANLFVNDNEPLKRAIKNGHSKVAKYLSMKIRRYN